MFKKKNKFLKKNNKKELIFYNELFAKLFLIPRSLVGDGFKKSIEILSKYIPYKYHYFPSGTKVFDWKVPKAWKVNRGVLLKNDGSEICNFFKNNLSLIQYSTPLKFKGKFKNFKKYLYHSDKLEKSTPYITSYYNKNHGFCIPLKEKNKIKEYKFI